MSELEDFITAFDGKSHLRIEDDFGGGFVRLNTAEAERRQAKHDIRSSEDIVIEMLRNARDAGAHTIFVATTREGARRMLTVIDDGAGIPEHMRELIFDARVTSKLDSMHFDTWGVHGRGMALYAVRENALEARVMDSMPGGGSALRVITDTESLHEKADQSTRPVFALSESGTMTVRGPRNIVRTVSEFAYIDRSTVAVYLGSPVEIAATLWSRYRKGRAATERAFGAEARSLPICERLAASSTPEDFAATASELGLDMSSRSARRIMDGEIGELPDEASAVTIATPQPKQGGNRAKENAIERTLAGRPKSKIPFSQDDIEHLATSISEAYAGIAQAYYLDPAAEIGISVKQDAIRIVIPLHMLP